MPSIRRGIQRLLQWADVWPGMGATAWSVADTLSVPGADRPAENLAIVFACVTARREAVAKVPLRITDAAGDLVESGPLWALLRQPNGQMGWGQYVRVIETHMTLYNVFAVHVVRGPSGEVDELVPLSPSGITPEMGIHERAGTPVAVQYQYTDPSTGAQRVFKPDEILLARGFNPYAPLSALSPVASLRRTILGESAARESNLGQLKSGARGTLLLESDSPITVEQADEIRETFEARYSGWRNRNRPIVLHSGLKANDVGLTPQEMEWIESLRFLRQDYYMVFRVTPALVFEMTGETGLSQGSATADQNLMWWENVGLGELDLIAQTHQALIDDYGVPVRGLSAPRAPTVAERRARRAARVESAGGAIWFDDNAIPALVRHRLGRVEVQAKLLAAGYRPDDVNDYLDLGLPGHPDNAARIPFSLTSIEEGEEEEAQPPAEPPARQWGAALECLERGLSAAVERAARAPAKSFAAFVAPRAKEAARRWSRFFLEQRKRVRSAMWQVSRAAGDGAAAALLTQIFPRQAEDKHLVARLSPLWRQHLADGVGYFERETGTEVGLQIDRDPRLMQALERRTIQGTRVNDTTEEDLRGILREGFEAGWTNQMIADRIEEYYRDNCVGEAARRPLTAARTQTAGIVNEGRMIAAREVGGLLKTWVHGSPEEARPGHVAAETRYAGHAIPLDADFELLGADGVRYACAQPGDTRLPVGEVANCTCSVAFVKG